MVVIKVNEDLERERQACQFNVEELTNYWDGGKESTADRRRFEQKVIDSKLLTDDVPEIYMSHKEKYENVIRKGVIYQRLITEQDKQQKYTKEIERAKANFPSAIEIMLFKEVMPFSVHRAMFIPGIAGLGTEEQQALWLDRAKRMEIIGCYAQTELGHGTFIRGLETTATYDPSTEEFVLHSPTLTSYKWWPGGLGNTANYCIVMAHLNIKGKSHGIQPFLVQLRDEGTHEPLPGIKLGEIGAKLGFNTADNGFLGFDYIRIPRERMLMKNAQVLKDGTFTATNSKLTYATMVFVRVMVVHVTAQQVALAATIAVRYSAVRRQSRLSNDKPEVQILDFVTQQHKLFITIASCYAVKVIANWLWQRYAAVHDELTRGDSDSLAEVHALSCGLKAMFSSEGSRLVERCRLACGGQGYMMSSGLPQLYGQVSAACTYEGENTVLMLQTARYLVKELERAEDGKALGVSLQYLSEKKMCKKWDNSVEGIINGFQSVAKGKYLAAVKCLQKYMKSEATLEEAWNKSSVQLVAASEAHCYAVVMSTYKSEMEKTTKSFSEPLRRVLDLLVELYTTYWALEKMGDLLLYTTISREDVSMLQQRYENLLSALRPIAVGIVDAFDFKDEFLNSTLGAYDGRVYDHLMEEAMKSPLNKQPVNDSFHKYLKPLMQGKL